jgi:transcriptional antiterminator NusG
MADKKEPKKNQEKAAKEEQKEEKALTGSAGTFRRKKLEDELRWYVLNIQPGQETNVVKAIKQRIRATEMEESIKDILVPTQKKIAIKKGEQDIKEERIFPGYILINMKLNPKTWELITNTENVRGFVRTDKYPRPLPEEEVEAIQRFKEVEQPAYSAKFSVSEAVKITDGVFADYIGSVQEIDEEKGKVTVLVSFLGREAPYELDFNQVEKL